MALTVEDGSNVANADTYATIAEARAYALKRGVTLPVSDSTVEAYMIEAMDLIERLNFQGERRYLQDQPLEWPRSNVWLHDDVLDQDEIPQLLKDAQCRLAMDRHNLGAALQPNGTGREVLSESVQGAVSVTYGATGSGTVSPVFNVALALLEPLLANAGALTLRRL
jgi:hypothetical protein